MRAILGAVLLSSFTLGCSPPARIDPTPNRMSADPASATYPAGPYGYVAGSTVDNYNFLGKLAPPPGSDYLSMMMQQIDLSTIHDDSNTKLLLIEGSALWCYWCNQEAPKVKELAAKYADQGFRVLNVLPQGGTQGVPATEADLNLWTRRYQLSQYIVALDPEDRTAQYGDVSAFPLHLLISTSKMKIEWMYVGGNAPLEENITAFFAQ